MSFRVFRFRARKKKIEPMKKGPKGGKGPPVSAKKKKQLKKRLKSSFSEQKLRLGGKQDESTRRARPKRMLPNKAPVNGKSLSNQASRPSLGRVAQAKIGGGHSKETRRETF